MVRRLQLLVDSSGWVTVSGKSYGHAGNDWRRRGRGHERWQDWPQWHYGDRWAGAAEQKEDEKNGKDTEKKEDLYEKMRLFQAEVVATIDAKFDVLQKDIDAKLSAFHSQGLDTVHKLIGGMQTKMKALESKVQLYTEQLPKKNIIEEGQVMDILQMLEHWVNTTESDSAEITEKLKSFEHIEKERLQDARKKLYEESLADEVVKMSCTMKRLVKFVNQCDADSTHMVGIEAKFEDLYSKITAVSTEIKAEMNREFKHIDREASDTMSKILELEAFKETTETTMDKLGYIHDAPTHAEKEAKGAVKLPQRRREGRGRCDV
eukprot:TRINITY_DN30201_c0_g1_i1.p1 TRINITY_DN30201_c0_g1~~TRINITY_DN30201_c0_g1_i1.p1  ORF type:complete len:320 (-),score=105.41 TRINITY_DN30201_c0_g1_i1:176-1135(-)